MARFRRLRMPMDSKKPLAAMGFSLCMFLLAMVYISKSANLGFTFKLTGLDAGSITDFLFVTFSKYAVAALLFVGCGVFIRRKVKFLMLPIGLYCVITAYLHIFEPLLYGSFNFFGDLVPLLFSGVTLFLFYDGLYHPGRSNKLIQFVCLVFGFLLLILTLSYRGPYAEDSAYQGKTIFTSSLLYALCYYFALAAVASGLSSDPSLRYYSRSRSAARETEGASPPRTARSGQAQGTAGGARTSRLGEYAHPASPRENALEGAGSQEPGRDADELTEDASPYAPDEEIQLFDPQEQRRKRAALRKKQRAREKAEKKKSKSGIDEI